MRSNIALLIVDVQIGLIDGLPAYQGAAVVQRIAWLAAAARTARVPVIYVQHDGAPGHRLEPDTPGWPIHGDIAPQADDLVVRKRYCDSFFETVLQSELQERRIEQLVIAGCMTEYCIDTTSRRSVSLGYDVTLVKDAHSTADKGQLSAAQVIAHHNEVLDGFQAGRHSIIVKPAASVAF
jgi:nicotinamidase-related amidase